MGPVSDGAESIRVGANAKAHLCSIDDLSGTCAEFSGTDGSRPNLADTPVGANKARSIRVRQLLPYPDPALIPDPIQEIAASIQSSAVDR